MIHVTNVSCLVYGPHNIIGILAAVRYYGNIKQDDSVPHVITIVHNPGLTDEEMKESSDIIYHMIKPFGWAPPIVMGTEDVDTITHNAFWKGSDA